MRKAAIVLLIASSAMASQPLETETARLLHHGDVKIEATAEYQTSHEGTERAFPFVFEYGLSDRTELTVEPVFGTSIRPKHAPPASGAGDVEVTLTHLFKPESSSIPAFALAAELKLPTAKNEQIGTGKTDYTLWGIASKRFGRMDVHGNLGYTVVGKPTGTDLRNIVNYAVAEEFHLSPAVDIVAEVLGNTSSTGETVEGAPSPAPVPAEASAGESSIMAGLRWHHSPAITFALGVSYDNNHAFLIRPGLTWHLGRK
jgi:hypothetical protein